MTALTPPPEHAELRPPLEFRDVLFHWIKFRDGHRIVARWSKVHDAWIMPGFNEPFPPADGISQCLIYCKPCDPDAIPLPDVETIARALAAKSRGIFESKTGRKLLGDDDVEAWNEHAGAVLAAISGEPK